MDLQIINDCAESDPGLPTPETDPGGRFIVSAYMKDFFTKRIINFFLIVVDNVIN